VTDPKHDLNEDVELGALVQANTTKSRGPVVAVRMSPDLLARINEYAQTHGTSVSEVLRTGAERLMDQTIHIGPNFVSGTVVYGTTLVTGSPSLGSGRSQELAADQPNPATTRS